MADQRLRVTFIEIVVNKDGDPIGRGSLYWSFSVDGVEVTSRNIQNPFTTGSGTNIPLGQTYTVTKSRGASLTVSGSVSEKDDLDKDENGTFSDNYVGNGWGTGVVHSPHIVDRNLDVNVNYKIEKV